MSRVILCFFITLLFGCGNAQESLSSRQQNALVGSWEYVSGTRGRPVPGINNITGVSTRVLYVFEADGTFYSTGLLDKSGLPQRSRYNIQVGKNARFTLTIKLSDTWTASYVLKIKEHSLELTSSGLTWTGLATNVETFHRVN